MLGHLLGCRGKPFENCSCSKIDPITRTQVWDKNAVSVFGPIHSDNERTIRLLHPRQATQQEQGNRRSKTYRYVNKCMEL